MTCRIGFVMDQIAGHITNYHNLRGVAAEEDIDATWHEIYYYKHGGRIERFRERVLPFLPSYPTGVLRGALETRRALQHTSYDALFSNASVSVFFSNTYRRVPTLFDFDSTPVQIDQMEGYDSPVDSQPVAYFKWHLFRTMLHSVTLLQAWSHWAKQSAIDVYGVPPEKIVVNPPGVDLQFWQPDAAAHSAARPLRVLFVGGDFRRKGGHQLLEWYRQQDPAQCELHIVTREQIPTQPGVVVHHAMQPNTPELLRLYQQSDLFVLPSLGECFGIATVEAMAAGLPVITSDAGGTADIIAPGRNGFIVPRKDTWQLYQAIDTILNNPDLRRSMRTQSRKLAEERFDVARNARQTIDYLRQIANDRLSTSNRPYAAARRNEPGFRRHQKDV